jgi:hypothetical protein
MKPWIQFFFTISTTFNWYISQTAISHLNMKKAYLLHLEILLFAHKKIRALSVPSKNHTFEHSNVIGSSSTRLPHMSDWLE